MKRIETQIYESPVGRLLLGVCEGALCLCDWAHGDRRPVWERVMRAYGLDAAQFFRGFTSVFENYRKFSMSSSSVGDGIDGPATQLDEYFRGERRVFDMEVRMVGTAFQIEVWRALCQIPYGETMSYSELAAAIGRPTAVRAVAAAARANALSIVVPCHRLIGANGALTGYAGGIDAKRALLDLERR